MGKGIPGRDYKCQTSFWYLLNSWSINFLAALSKAYEGFPTEVEEIVHLVQLQAVLFKKIHMKTDSLFIFLLICGFGLQFQWYFL